MALSAHYMQWQRQRWLLTLLLVTVTHWSSLVVLAQKRLDGGAMFYPLWPGFTSSTWQLSEARVNQQQPVHFVWLLPQTEPDALRERFEAVSDPTSSQYMQYMTAEQIRQHLRPSITVVQAVLNYLTQHGVDTASAVVDYGDSLAVRATVSQVQAMFGTTMSWYRSSAVNSSPSRLTTIATSPSSKGAGQRLVLRATAGVTVPAHLAASTRLLLNLVDPPMSRRPALGRRAGDTDDVQRAHSTPGHTFHSMQSNPPPSGVPNYISLSCILYGPNQVVPVTTSDFLQARYNITARRTVAGFDGVRVGIFGGIAEADDVYGLNTRDCYDSDDLANIGAAYGYQQQPIPGTAPYARGQRPAVRAAASSQRGELAGQPVGVPDVAHLVHLAAAVVGR